MTLTVLKNSVIAVLIVALGSCSSHDSGIDRLVAERDSLRLSAQQSQSRLVEINEAMDILVSSLDSIATQEGVLLTNRDSEGRLFSRREMRDRIEAFSDLLERQRQRIATLAQRLNEKEMDTADFTRLSALVDNLNAQIDRKNDQISHLKSELADKNSNIKRLNAEITELTENIVALESSNIELQEALTTQDIVINECYFIAGDSKTLEKKGILQGGFLRKKKLNHDALIPANFDVVDIRHYNEYTAQAKKAQLLTPAPTGSYEIVKQGDKILLRILDATAFWSLSNYQVLKLN